MDSLFWGAQICVVPMAVCQSLLCEVYQVDGDKAILVGCHTNAHLGITERRKICVVPTAVRCAFP